MSPATLTFGTGYRYLMQSSPIAEPQLFSPGTPTAEEMQQLENADDQTLRNALLSLMQGGGFHEFYFEVPTTDYSPTSG